MQMKSLFAASAVACALVGASSASADVLYQSVPDLTVPPDVGLCSACYGDGLFTGQQFTLGAAVTATDLSFTTESYAPFWPATVTVDVFQDADGVLGADLYHQTFSTFTSDVALDQYTDLVSLHLGAMILGAGTYDLFLSNPTDFTWGSYSTTGQGELTLHLPRGSQGPTSGTSYLDDLTNTAGFQLDGHIGVPEPAAWALMIVGFGGAGAMLRRRRTLAAA